MILWWCRSIRGIKLNVLKCTTGSTCSDPMPRRASKYHHVRVKMSACPISKIRRRITLMKCHFSHLDIFLLIRSHKVKYGSNKVILNSFQLRFPDFKKIRPFNWPSKTDENFISHEYFINSEIQINLTSARLGRAHVMGCHVILYLCEIPDWGVLFGNVLFW